MLGKESFGGVDGRTCERNKRERKREKKIRKEKVKASLSRPDGADAVELKFNTVFAQKLMTSFPCRIAIFPKLKGAEIGEEKNIRKYGKYFELD